MTPCQKLLKQEGTARRIESMQQSSATPSLHLWFLGVAEDCCMLSILLAVPSCFSSFWHGVIPTSYFIFNDFYTCTIRHHKVGWRACNNFLQPHSLHLGVLGLRKIVACSQPHLAGPSCIYSSWHSVIPTFYFDFALVYVTVR